MLIITYCTFAIFAILAILLALVSVAVTKQENFLETAFDIWCRMVVPWSVTVGPVFLIMGAIRLFGVLNDAGKR